MVEHEYNRLFKLFKENPEAYEVEKKNTMYPSEGSRDFVEKLLKRKEFGRYVSPDLSVAKGSYDSKAQALCSSKDFRLTPNQSFISNFLSPYTHFNSLLLYHNVGVGKTATAISLAEKYYDVHKRRVLVILSGNIKDNFKKQIFDITKYDKSNNVSQLVTGTKYTDMVFDKEFMTDEQLEAKINKLIKERYQFIGYRELVLIIEGIEKRVAKFETNPERAQIRADEKVREYFSNRLIIIDEAHNLRMASETGEKKISTAFLKLLQKVENTKLLLMTATPMFNEAKEIIWLLNLLLTNNKKPILKTSDIFDKEGNLIEKGFKKVQKIASSYISFMRGENPYTFPFRLYPSINNDPTVIKEFPEVDVLGNKIKDGIKHLELVGSSMSKHQRAIYNQFKIGVKNDDNLDNDLGLEGEEGASVDSDIQKAIQISNVAYPQGVGKSGFDTSISRIDKKGFKYNSNSEQFFKYDNLSKYAPKIKTIIDKIISSKGIVFVYSQFYYSGIFPLALALEHVGFRKYSGSQLLVNGDVDMKVNNKPSYIILSRDKFASPNNDAEIAIAKSKENADGNIIKVVIVSRIGTEGLDFKRIREVHLLEPWFNMNRIEQIIGRAVRTCSHIDLPQEERNVTIYMHANQYDKKNSEESVDLRMYRIAETKQIKIAVVERLIKESSIDCPLNKSILNMTVDKINTKLDIETSQGKKIPYQVGDKDGSFLCGFGKCDITCKIDINKEDFGIDNTTFDPIFISDEIDLYKRYISDLYLEKKFYTFEEIYKVLHQKYKLIDSEVLQYTLDYVVEHRVSMTAKGYLILRGDIYILQENTNIRSTLSERTEVSKLPSKVSIFSKKPVVEKPPSPKKPVISKVNDDLLERIAALEELKQFNISEKVIIDSVVDKISEQEIKNVITNFDDLDKRIQASLLTSGAFFGSNYEYFYNYFDNKYYNRKWELIGPIEQGKHKVVFDRFKESLWNALPETIKGFIESRKGEAKFKIKDNPTTSGYVCAQTSSLTIDDLRNRLEFGDNVGKKTKKVLCEIYECKLRMQPGLFMRPWLKK